MYEANFVISKYDGNGKFSWPDGHYYEGEFNDGKMNGKGKQVEKSGEIIEGAWINSKRNGNFKITKKESIFYCTYADEYIDKEVYESKDCILF